ncbi:conjugal transfer protein TraG [Orientia tsutsugamushi]|nr:putative conjugative transfer protein TraG [Orientia tsutsugamushi str. TA763]KJV73005.1 putative conjugative transfer protein TraG [Orientia tsutsugamushi str. TA763]SPP24416.1 conjugal transfer protein TraG [Orientia tsutsugamushi]
MILYSYATFQMLASSIPMLSWGVLKACAHATANLASQFSPIPVASSLGSNIVDNNLSMDNYSIGNRTISQQNLAHFSDSIKNKTKKNQEEFDNTSNSALVLAGKLELSMPTPLL